MSIKILSNYYFDINKMNTYNEKIQKLKYTLKHITNKKNIIKYDYFKIKLTKLKDWNIDYNDPSEYLLDILSDNFDDDNDKVGHDTILKFNSKINNTNIFNNIQDFDQIWINTYDKNNNELKSGLIDMLKSDNIIQTLDKLI